jgi:hypothetical protein
VLRDASDRGLGLGRHPQWKRLLLPHGIGARYEL